MYNALALTQEAPDAMTRVADPDRIGTLFDRHHARLFALALRMSGNRDEALDLVQETFVRAVRRSDTIPKDEGAAESWLVRVQVNLCRDRWRRQRVRTRAARHIVLPASTSPEASTVLRAAVRTALATLAPRRRAIVVMADIEGLTSAEIGAVLDLSAVTVRWHLSAGRKALRALLQTTPPEHPDHG